MSQHKGADNKSLMQQTFPEAPKPTDFSLWSGYGTTCIHNYPHYGSTSAQKCGFAWFLLVRQHFAFVVVCKEWLTTNIIGKKWSNLFIFTWIKLLCVHLIYLTQTTIYCCHLFKQILHLMNSVLVSTYENRRHFSHSSPSPSLNTGGNRKANSCLQRHTGSKTIQ